MAFSSLVVCRYGVLARVQYENLLMYLILTKGFELEAKGDRDEELYCVTLDVEYWRGKGKG